MKHRKTTQSELPQSGGAASWKRTLKKWVQFFLNPRLILCFGMAWMVTNGWCYVFMFLGTWWKLSWMLAVGTAYAGFLWFPFTPEKLVTLAIAIWLLKRLFPQDEKTLKLLHEERQKLHDAIARRRAKKRGENAAAESAQPDRRA